MGGTIGQQSSMDEPSGTVGRFLSILDAALGGSDDGIEAFRSELHRIETLPLPNRGGSRGGVAFDLPVCRWWDEALGADPSMDALAQALRNLGALLRWVQNPNYVRNPPGPGWLDNYGYAVIAGPDDGPPALARHDALAIGVLLLGPRAHYPLHAHPAREIYLPFGTAEWWRDEGPWRVFPPGSVIHHASMTPHATRAFGAPLLAIYLWMGELAVHARLV